MSDESSSSIARPRRSSCRNSSRITNLFTKKIGALKDGSAQRTIIEVSSDISGVIWSLSIGETGPVIAGIRKSEIGLPGRTMRRKDTAIGLTIVRDAVHGLGGEVHAIKNGPLGDAVIALHLPIIGA